ncbi:MAG: ScpA family protein [Cardiobacteriaceae bacterium]|nr:ScpA family protein [Cardiobacteriaceae bacterium]
MDKTEDTMKVLVMGEPYTQVPKDLYIPPDALRVLLMAFEGPLDLLLYLIRKHNFDVLNIPVSDITEQYLRYMQLMEQLDMGLAAEYLLMAATLGEIKARLLFPTLPQILDGESTEDPRLDLMAQLQKYAQIKLAAQSLAQYSRVGEQVLLSGIRVEIEEPVVAPAGDAKRLHQCLELLARQQGFRQSHHVEEDTMVLSQCLASMRERLEQHQGWQNLEGFYLREEARAGLVLNLMAMLELDREQEIEWYQEQYFAPVFLKKR